jgi:hypothetical protein
VVAILVSSVCQSVAGFLMLFVCPASMLPQIGGGNI